MGEARGGRKPRKGNGRIWMGGSGQRSRARTLWQFCPPDVSNWNGLRPFFHFPPPAALTKKRWLGGCHASDLPRSPSTFLFYPLPRLLLHCCVEHLSSLLFSDLGPRPARPAQPATRPSQHFSTSRQPSVSVVGTSQFVCCSTPPTSKSGACLGKPRLGRDT